MIINIKDTIKGFFFAYLKYWILLFIIILFFIFTGIKRYYTGTDSITLNEKNVVFVGTGIAINKKYIVTNYNIVDQACDFPYRGTRKFFALDKNRIYALTLDRADPINDLALMRLDKYGENFAAYSILQIESENYNKNKKLLIPRTINVIGNFIFRNARVLENGQKGFFVASKNRLTRENASGSPVFNQNLILQGIVKEKNPSYYNKMDRRDEILNKANIQSIYFVNNIEIIRDFLNKYVIEYYVAPGDLNLRNKEYNIENSIVNIICIKDRKLAI